MPRSLRKDMLVLKDQLITLRSPAQLDVAVNQLTIRVRTWLGGAIGAPVVSGPQFTDTNLVLPQKYVIRSMTTREITESGGEYRVDDVLVAGLVPNDPANGSIGFTNAQLAPILAQGQERIYLITGPLNGEYALHELRTGKPFSYDLVLRRRRTTPTVT